LYTRFWNRAWLQGFRFVRRSVFVSIGLEIDIVFEWPPAADVLRKVPLFFC
jgi:hypothetical protein